MRDIVVGKVLENQKVGAVQNLQNGQYALLKKNNGQISCIQSASVTNSNLSSSSVSAVIVGPSTSYSNTGSTPSFKRLEIKNASNSALTSVPSSVSALTVSLAAFSISASNRESLSSVCIFNASMNSIASKLIGQLGYGLSSSGLSVYDMYENCQVFATYQAQSTLYATIRDFNDNTAEFTADDVNVNSTIIDDHSACQQTSYAYAIEQAKQTGYSEITYHSGTEIYAVYGGYIVDTIIFEQCIKNFYPEQYYNFSYVQCSEIYFKQNSVNEVMDIIGSVGIGIDAYGHAYPVVVYCLDGVIAVNAGGGSSGGEEGNLVAKIDKWTGFTVVGFGNVNNNVRALKKVNCSVQEAYEAQGTYGSIGGVSTVICHNKGYYSWHYTYHWFVFGEDMLFYLLPSNIYDIYQTNYGTNMNGIDLAEIHINATATSNWASAATTDYHCGFYAPQSGHMCSKYSFNKMTVDEFLHLVDIGALYGFGIIEYMGSNVGKYPVICYCSDGVVLFNAGEGSSNY